jgi:histidyl-tRNA synthetase
MAQPKVPLALRSRGMRDLLPADMRAFRRVEDAFREAASRWGYAELRTPTIEPYSLFTTAGALTPQMLSRVYSFLDWDGWSGERVVLRPDSTIPVARAVAEAGLPLPQRLFYVQNVFRFSTAEVDREEWQFGLEYLEAPAILGDAEVSLVACETLSALGLEPVVRLSHAGILRTLVEATCAGDRVAGQALFDRVATNGLGSAIAEFAAHAGAGALVEVAVRGPGGLALIDNLAGLAQSMLPAAVGPLDDLRTVAHALAGTGLRVEVDPAMVRDFEYYTGTIFEFVSGGGSWGGGGRYTPAGVEGPASACGAALYAAPLAIAMAPTTRPAVVVAVTPVSSADVGRALTVARELHRGGVPAALARPGDAREPGVRVDGGTLTALAGGRERKIEKLEDLVALLLAEK